MTFIELVRKQAAALEAKVAAQGLIHEPEEAPPSPQDAVARILELQKRVKADPEGWTVHDYINHGRP